MSRSGIVPRGPTQDRAGPMARSVYDVAALLSVMAGWDAEDGDTLPAMSYFPRGDWSKQLGAPDLRGKRIGVLREMLDGHPYDEEVKAIFEQALVDMKKAGAIVIDPVMTGLNLRVASSNALIGTSHPRLGPVDLPYELIPATNGYLKRLGPKRPWQKLEDMLVKVGPGNLSTEYYKALEFKSPETYPDYLSRQKLRIAVSKTVADRIAELELDAVVHPYQSAPPPPWDASKDKYAGSSARTNNLTSATGLPGIIMPAGYTAGNLPVALQFVTGPFEDLTLLQVAYGYEQASKRRVPPAPHSRPARRKIQLLTKERNHGDEIQTARRADPGCRGRIAHTGAHAGPGIPRGGIDDRWDAEGDPGREDHLPGSRAGVPRARQGVQRHVHGAGHADGKPIRPRRGAFARAADAFPRKTVAASTFLPDLVRVQGPADRVRANGDDDLGSERAAAVRHASRHSERRSAQRAGDPEHSRRAFGELQGEVRRASVERSAAGIVSRGCDAFRQQPDALEHAAELDKQYGSKPDLKKLPMYCVVVRVEELVRREGHARHRRQRHQLRDGCAEARFAGRRGSASQGRDQLRRRQRRSSTGAGDAGRRTSRRSVSCQQARVRGVGRPALQSL